MRKILLPVSFIGQTRQADCLAACAATVLNYYGEPFDYERLLKLLRVQDFGALPRNILALEQLGIPVVYKEGTLEELHDHLSHDRPCIAFVQTGELPYWDEDVGHAVVVIGLDDEHVYLNDPAHPIAPVLVTQGDFGLAWLGRDEYYAAFMRRNP